MEEIYVISFCIKKKGKMRKVKKSQLPFSESSMCNIASSRKDIFICTVRMKTIHPHLVLVNFRGGSCLYNGLNAC